MGPIINFESVSVSASLVAVLSASLAGSLHCVAMCGPIALLARGESRWHPAWYHVGRLVGYVGLGTLAGAFGNSILATASVGHLQTALAAGLALLLVWTGIRFMRGAAASAPGAGILQRPLERGLRGSLRFPTPVRNTIIGLLSVLLPCGWLYTFVLAGAATGSALIGGLVLLTFWLGTVPVFVAGTSLSRLPGFPWLEKPRLKQGIGVAMIFLGLHSIHQHLGARPAPAVEPGASAPAEPVHHCH